MWGEDSDACLPPSTTLMASIGVPLDKVIEREPVEDLPGEAPAVAKGSA